MTMRNQEPVSLLSAPCAPAVIRNVPVSAWPPGAGAGRDAGAFGLGLLFFGLHFDFDERLLCALVFLPFFFVEQLLRFLCGAADAAGATAPTAARATVSASATSRITGRRPGGARRR